MSNSFYGGDICTIYDNLAFSSASNPLEEGSHTVITISKDTFDKPDNSKDDQIPTEFDEFLRLEILETTDLYQICIYYKKLSVGYKAGTAVKLKLTPRMIVNGSTHKITQDFLMQLEIDCPEESSYFKEKLL